MTTVGYAFISIDKMFLVLYFENLVSVKFLPLSGVDPASSKFFSEKCGKTM